MKKTVLAGAAALGLGVVAFAGGASAQCVWNGYSWDCNYANYYSAPAPADYYRGPPPYYPYYPQPSAGTSNPEITGYKPEWAPSQYGPRASGGSGR